MSQTIKNLEKRVQEEEEKLQDMQNEYKKNSETNITIDQIEKQLNIANSAKRLLEMMYKERYMGHI